MKTLLLILAVLVQPFKTTHYSTEAGMEIYTILDNCTLKIHDVPPYLLKGCSTQIELHYFDGRVVEVNCPTIKNQVVYLPNVENCHITTIKIGGREFWN